MAILLNSVHNYNLGATCDKHWTCGIIVLRNAVYRKVISLLPLLGQVTHICVSELTIIGSDNGLSPGRRQAIIWNNAGLLLIKPLGTKFSEISIGIQTFSFMKMHLNMSAKWSPFCLGLNVLRQIQTTDLFTGMCLIYLPGCPGNEMFLLLFTKIMECQIYFFYISDIQWESYRQKLRDQRKCTPLPNTSLPMKLEGKKHRREEV